MEGRVSPDSAPAKLAYHSSLNLCNTLKHSSPRRGTVYGIIQELEALSAVLSRLADTGDETPSELGLPLERCIKACEGFQHEVMKWSDDEGRVQGWRKLRYMGYSVDSFKQLLAVYKLTVEITIANANLETSAITAEQLDEYRELADSARATLEDHDDVVEEIFEVEDATPALDETALDDIEQERFAAQNCRRIRSRFSRRIRNMKPLGESAPFDFPGVSGGDTGAHSPKSEKGVTEIDNYATGDCVQLMFSNRQQPFRGRNRGFGNMSIQGGGHSNDKSIQQISKNFESISRQYLAARNSAGDTEFAENSPPAETTSGTNRRHQRLQLTSGSPTSTPESELWSFQGA